jgi:hypothetical protein
MSAVVREPWVVLGGIPIGWRERAWIDRQLAMSVTKGTDLPRMPRVVDGIQRAIIDLKGGTQ